MATDPVDDINVGLQELAELEAQYTIFVGSSPEDVSYATTFWNSLALQPPIESRLVSADIGQRLKVAKDPSIKTAPRPSAPQNDAIFEKISEQRAEEDRQKYKDMAKRRDQIMVLLKKQREERVKREMISRPFKPKQCHQSNRHGPDVSPQELDEDIQHVRSLQ
ncbi:cilia- and flagella-associated protein HOATZ [Alosa sapidissima]|uniref:cilia- and flagella-associated protein HOATZ n=1 Tax=Alosa sapidissima TaxID=34773 RepID=UPI001C090A65|nr:cilia- and flagella-associated protein HOATZ [Alosa sapidissima]